MALRRGTNGIDTLIGTAGIDRFYGLDGDDSILAGGGADEVSAGDGNDTVLGEDGNDFIAAGAGSDSVEGGAGYDYILGAGVIGGSTDAARDTLSGGDGMDVIYGGYGDLIDGGTGDDIISSSALFVRTPTSLGQATLLGGDGDDSIQANSGDSIDGGADDDTLFLFGFEVEKGPAPTINLSRVHQSQGVDIGDGTIVKNVERVFLQLDEVPNGVNVIGSTGDDVIDAFIESFNGVGVVARGYTGDDILVGSDYGDKLFGQNGDDILSGGAGKDVLVGGPGADLFHIGQLAEYEIDGPDIIRDFGPDDAFLIGGLSFQQTPLAFSDFLFDDADQDDPLVSGPRAVATSQTGGQFLFNTLNNILSYDADGAMGDGPMALFRLDGAPTLTADQFVFVDID